ncbi:glycogen debranching enzyme [Photobacterium jeanii]|uniref:Glycogen debranching enzyme n=1 Tax=Photobacterium jeanii TaxID=858640 RepID=A0A178KC00_9GAMM|nr:glycogen debranching protein GlgX [Photobacterium jeanii]OAN14202.1 glycogen debranching enzyme [Photobacterium jeanii]PST89721.1 glycogen debranching enzyme GlgX [Photobacterium jeanii]
MDVVTERQTTAVTTPSQEKGIYSWPGKAYPLGATVQKHGVNFSLYSKHATKVVLHLFKDRNDSEPLLSFDLNSTIHKRGHYWFVFIGNIGHGQVYAFQVDGPWQPEAGLRFDAEKVLVDPYSHALCFSEDYQRERAIQAGSNMDACMKSVVVDHMTFDWQRTQSPRHSLTDTVIYEMHVAGFTRHPNSGVSEEKRGTYAGVIEKIPYLKSLGVTAVELMPVQQFDLSDAPPGRENYWGYSPINFFALHSGYSVEQDPLAAINEFKTMVRELHKAGIEVILDVVFNHTAEGDENGPTFCFKGLQNPAYYLIDKQTGQYANYSGCGNTCNANHSVLRRMIIDALHYWVTEMKVDGFRFDLASVLARDSDGQPMSQPPLLWSIDSDPILSSTKIIAEAWDAAGLYQVGSFIGDRWNEWNGKYRDDVRAFWRGDSHTVSRFASRILGSPDIYGCQHHSPHRSVNFICAHDGFTLNDLVSYSEKHNWDNGEHNRDGDNHNLSCNYGVEGPTTVTEIEALRHRQCKNMLATLFLSLGTPMLNMGDEVRRTQQGNNNAYCQNNELSWFDWQLVDKHADLYRFVSMLSQLRSKEPTLDWNMHRSLNSVLDSVEICWHGIEPHQPDWGERSHTLALTVNHPLTDDELYVVCNAYWDPLEFTIPDREQTDWHLVIDTAAPSPCDIYSVDEAPRYADNSVVVTGRSMVVMVAK